MKEHGRAFPRDVLRRLENASRIQRERTAYVYSLDSRPIIPFPSRADYEMYFLRERRCPLDVRQIKNGRIDTKKAKNCIKLARELTIRRHEGKAKQSVEQGRFIGRRYYPSPLLQTFANANF